VLTGPGPGSDRQMSFPKDPYDGVPLAWSAHPDGVPFRRGDAPDLIRKEELARATTKLAGVMSKVLRIPEQIDEYTRILTWISTGAAALRFEERRPDPADAGKWTVWLCWVEVRGHIPNAGSR